jgi:hypothetical protein
MKIVARTNVVLVALLAWLSIATSEAAGQSSPSRYRTNHSYLAANPAAQSRVSNRTSAQPSTTTTQAPESVPAPLPQDSMTYDAGPDGPSFLDEGDPAMWEDGSCSDGYCGVDDCGTCRRGLWYFSLDYLLVRPRFSQGVAFNTRTVSDDDDIETSSETDVAYDFDYNSAFRTSIGYRLLDCGGDIQFTYWRMTGSSQASDGPASLSNDQLIITGMLDNSPGQGEFLSAFTGVTANIYDIDFAKCLSFGGPEGDCGDCGFCPRWDMRYLAGVRIGDVSRYNNNQVLDANGDLISFGDINARFVGAGPRVGLQGRRYFGACGNWSIFAKGSQALLIGDYNMVRKVNQLASGTANQGSINSQTDSFARMIPVTDIELGGTWQVAPYAFFSAGWFWQCWWDLGQGEVIGDSTFGPLDTSNILGFDGLFIRGELLF